MIFKQIQDAWNWFAKGGGFTTDPSGNPAANTVLNSGSAQDVTPENIVDGNSTANIVAAAPVEIDVSAFGLPYQTVIFTRTGSTGNVGLTWGLSTVGILTFDLTWSAGADAVNITATNSAGDTFTNIPYDVAGTVAVAAITADAFGTVYRGR